MCGGRPYGEPRTCTTTTTPHTPHTHTQMLLSLALLSKLGLIHADIKPHNILSNERYNVIKVSGARVRS